MSENMKEFVAEYAGFVKMLNDTAEIRAIELTNEEINMLFAIYRKDGRYGRSTPADDTSRAKDVKLEDMELGSGSLKEQMINLVESLGFRKSKYNWSRNVGGMWWNVDFKDDDDREVIVWHKCGTLKLNEYPEEFQRVLNALTKLEADYKLNNM